MPQRFLRPGITTSRRFNGLTMFAQNIWIRLLTLVDDFGRYDADLRLLRSHAFPFGNESGKDIPLPKIEDACRELAQKGLARFYRDPEQREVVELLKWSEKPRAQHSKYPDFGDGCEQMFTDANNSYPPSSSSSSSSSPLHPRRSLNGSGEPSQAADQEKWIKDLSQSPAYEGIDVRREFFKMMNWCQQNRKTASRKRFVNWLNKVDKPLRFAAKRQEIDPSKIGIAPEFTEWACEKYPARVTDIRGYRTWKDVPDSLRVEWKREKVTPMMKMAGAA